MVITLIVVGALVAGSIAAYKIHKSNKPVTASTVVAEVKAEAPAVIATVEADVTKVV